MLIVRLTKHTADEDPPVFAIPSAEILRVRADCRLVNLTVCDRLQLQRFSLLSLVWQLARR